MTIVPAPAAADCAAARASHAPKPTLPRRPRRRRASSSAASRTRPAHRRGRAARRHGARLRRLRCRRRLGLEDRLRRLRGGDRPVPPQVRARHPRPAPRRPRPCCRCWPRSRLCCPRTRAAPRRARRCSSSRRRSRSASSPPPRPRSRPPTSCSSPRPAPGLLAIFAELAGGRLVLNELAEARADLLGQLFPGCPVTRHDAAHIHDHLDGARAAERRADEPAVLGGGACRGRASPTPRCAMSRRRSRASPTAGAWSRSPAPASLPTIRPGATPSSACRNAGASCSPRPSTGASMPATARRSRRA